ncbi:fap1 adhesin isoform X2 [Nothobranchius furzeri]|uniref:fap1 adhesin isoform X2 n=1 Tax=Nothobranchius furzeri TaxID=105023 RepID=UPI003904C1B3
MPDQKRESDPHEPQPKLRKLDEDAEALPSKIGPATNSLITGQMKEQTEAAPRTKKKRSSSGEGESLPAKSSKQDSFPEDSSKTTSDPRLLKAKLLNATSASCGEAPSQRANSNASLKRSASTESDEDLSSDGSKSDFFRQRDDEDKAHCIRRNYKKTKCKAEESSDLLEGLPSSPADPVQMDHNYGRFSDATSPESTEDANEKTSRFFSQQGKQETPHNAKEKVSTGTSEPETRSIEATVEIDSAAEESKHNEFKDMESHINLDNKASASSGEVLDSVTPVGEENEQTDQAESIRIQRDVDNETIAQSEETLCSAIVEVTSSGRSDEPADDETDLAFISESRTHLSDQSVSEGDGQSIRCKFKDGEVVGQLDEVLLNKTTSAPEQVEIFYPSIETDKNATTEHVAIPETQTELKIQLSSAEKLNAADTVVRLCDDVNDTLKKSEETLEENVQEPADVSRPASCPGPLVEGETNHFFEISDSCTDTSPECKSVHEENKIERLAEKNLVPEGQITPVDLQSQENHLVYDSITNAAAEVKEDVVISHCFASPDTQIQENSNPDVTVETQSQEVYESATTLSTHVDEDNVETLTGNQECESLETLTVEASGISDPVPPSAEVHDDGVTADKCENSLERAGPAENQSAMETQTVEVELQEDPVSEPISDEDQRDPENASSDAGERVEAAAESLTGVELQTATVSEETQNKKMHIQMNQDVSGHTFDINVEAQRGVQNDNRAAKVQISHDVEAVVSSKDASSVMEEAEETQMVSKLTPDTSTQSQTVWEDKSFKNCEESESVSAAAQSRTEIGEDVKALSKEVSPIKVIQSQMVSEPIADMPEETHRDLENANCVAQIQTEDGVEADFSSDEAYKVMEEENQVVVKPTTDASNETPTVRDAAAAQTQIEVGEEANATSEEVSNVASIKELQTQMVSEPPTGIPEETHKEPESSTLKTGDVMFVSAAAQSQTEDSVEAEVSSAEVSNMMEEVEETQMVSKPMADILNETRTVWEDAAAQSQTEVGKEAKPEEVSIIRSMNIIQSHMVSDDHIELGSTNCVAEIQIEDCVETKITSEEASNIASIEEMQAQIVSEPITHIHEETHTDLDNANGVAQIQIEDGVEAEVSSEEASNMMEEAEETQMVCQPTTDISIETVWEDAAAQSPAEVGEEAKIVSEKASNIASIEEMQTQVVSPTGIPEETHKEPESSTLKTGDVMFVSAAAQSQTEDGVEAEVSSAEVSNMMEEVEETQMVSKPMADILNETQTVWDAAAAQSQTEVCKEAKPEEVSNITSMNIIQSHMVSDAHIELESTNFVAEIQIEDCVETKITSEEASNIASIEEMQTQMVSEPPTGIPEETHKEPESSTLKTGDVMFVSAAAQSQTEDLEEAKSTSGEVSKIAPVDQVQTQIVSEPITHIHEETLIDLDNANGIAQIQIEDGVEAEVSSEKASNMMEEAEETQMFCKPTTGISNETVWKDAAAQSPAEVGEEAKIVSEEASNIVSIEEMQTQVVSPTGIPEETHKEPESSTLKTGDVMFVSAAAQSQTEDGVEAEVSSAEVSNMMEEVEETQMVSKPMADILNETQTVWEDAAAQSQTEVGKEAKPEEVSIIRSMNIIQSHMVSDAHIELESTNCVAEIQIEDCVETKITSEEASNIASIEEMQAQIVSEPITHIHEETHTDLDNANGVAQIQIEDGVEAEVSSEEASNMMEEAEETQMVCQPTTDISIETVWEDAAAQSPAEVGEEAKIVSEKASNIASIEEMQTQMVSPTGIPEETHKEPESSTLKTGDVMFVSAAAQSQTEDLEEAKSTSGEVSKIAPVDQVQAQIVSEPTTDMSVGFPEENVKTAENKEVEFESVAVTPCQMEVEDQSYPAFSVGVNKIQTEMDTQMAEKSSNGVFGVGSQTQTNLDFSGQAKDETSEDVHEDMMVEAPQNMEINSENVTEQENQTQQITAESEISAAAPLVEMQSEKNENETSEQVSAEETQSQHVGEQITDVESVNVAVGQNETQTSPLSVETLIHTRLGVTEPGRSQLQSLRSSSDEDENKVTENKVDVAVRINEIQTQAAEMFEDISQPTTPEQTPSLVDQEVSELIRDTQVFAETQIQRSLGPTETFKDLPEQVEENSRIPSVDITEMTNKVKVAEALEEIPLPSAMELTQVQRGQEVSKVEEQNMQSVGSENHPITDMQTSAEFDQTQRCKEETDESVDQAASGCENVPEVLTETSAAASEHQNHLAEETGERAASDMKTTLLLNVDTKDKDMQVEPDDVISGPVRPDDNNEVIVAPVSTMEGGAESRDVIGFVCGQSDVQAPEEQIKPVNQSEFHDNQVVYEPISSPESNSGGGVCTTVELGETISFLDLQNTETHHTLGGESGILTSDATSEAAHSNQEEEIEKAEICVPESQAAAEMEVDTISEAQLEQSNTTEAFEQVAAVSSSDDMDVTEDATEKREIPVEVTEQVQEAAAAAPASDEAEVTDGSSEEYVILEPVPEDNIHFDIVTQAVAESGLSASLCPADVSGDEITNQNVLKDPQQAEVKEDDGGECPVLTSSGDILDQEMETNVLQDVSNSYHLPSSTTEETDITNPPQHTIEDAGLMVVENEKCHLDLQQVQILEDIEIGHEIVVAEENGNVTAVKPPDQPTEVSSEQSVQKVYDQKKKTNETAKQSKTEDEKKVPEVPKPKKQEMNTQARTKARLAALAEQKAAASKRSTNRQQLNLLALCQEIAEDIATDSMLLKKIEEEKQAAAVAAKAEARQKELLPAVSEVDPVSVATPAEPEESSGSVIHAPEPSPAQPSTAADDSAETKPVVDPPKRRFFISQVSVPLKAHEKKKLTRYQRLRQVELQREKMSWARVKKLKSDQANQMFSDVDWQASFSGGFLMSPPTPPPAPSTPKMSSTNPAETSQLTPPKVEAPTAETPTAETPTAETLTAETPTADTSTAEAAQVGPQQPKTSKTEPPKPESAENKPVKAEKSKTQQPPCENRRSTRQSKALALQTAAAPAPAPKVTRSASKKTLPAKPPPMPNGINAQKQKPVEYKPYRPRPKYSPDDFELDDDDLLLASPARPRPQQSPAAPCQKPPASSQPTNQMRLNPHTAPPGQISGRPKPAASAPPQLKTVVGATPSDSVTSETKPAAAEASVPQKTENLSSQEKEKSQKTADPRSPPLPLVECSKESDDAEKCEEKPAVTTSSSAAENNSATEEQTSEKHLYDGDAKHQDSVTHLNEASLQKEVKRLKEADKDSSQTIIDAGQKHHGPVACSMCGMLYSAANPEDESQHLLFHNQFISAVKYVGWKKERILAEFPDGKIILVLPDDPKYALKKVEEIREMVDNDLGFQQVETKCPSQTKTFLFITIDKKVAGCLIAENIQEGYRVIEEPIPEGSEGEKVMFERQRAWCCSTTPEPAICGISRIWVVSMMRRRGIATRMIECLRNNFIYGSYLSKDEIAFSDPTPDGKLFAMHYFGTSQFLVYNFVSGPCSVQPKTHAV